MPKATATPRTSVRALLGGLEHRLRVGLRYATAISASLQSHLFGSPLYRPYPTLIVPISVGRGVLTAHDSSDRFAAASPVDMQY